MESNITRLVNALKEDDTTDKFWWDILGTTQETRKIILQSYKENPTDEQLEYLAELLEIKDKNKIQCYNRCLEELRKELIQKES